MPRCVHNWAMWELEEPGRECSNLQTHSCSSNPLHAIPCSTSSRLCLPTSSALAQAKELREEIVQTRQVIATAARRQQQSNQEAKEKMIMFAAGGVKDTHDSIYKKKYVPKGAAEALQRSKYAASVA